MTLPAWPYCLHCRKPLTLVPESPLWASAVCCNARLSVWTGPRPVPQELRDRWKQGSLL